MSNLIQDNQESDTLSQDISYVNYNTKDQKIYSLNAGIEDDQVSNSTTAEDLLTKDTGTSFIEQVTTSIASTNARWGMLALLVGYRASTYFCLDQPATIQHEIQEQFGINTAEYGLLYSMIAVPNIVMPFVAGLSMDNHGLNKGILYAIIAVCVGQGICTVAAYFLNYPMLVTGRFVFALGYEPVNIAKTILIANWFKGREFNTASNVSLCLARLFVLLTGYLTPTIEGNSGMGAAFLFGFFICMISLAVSLKIIVQNRKLQEEKVPDKPLEGTSTSSRKPKLSCCQKTKLILNHIKADLKCFSYQYWLLVAAINVVYISILPITAMLSDMLQVKFGIGEVTAGIYFGAISAVGGFSLLFVGIIADKYGKLGLIMVIASIFVFLSHIYWFFLTGEACNETQDCYISVIPPIIMLGFAYGLFAGSCWNSIVYLVPIEKVGTANGVIGSFLGISLAIMPVVLGAVKDNTEEIGYGYFYITGILSITSAIGIILTIAIYFDDKQNNNSALNKVHKKTDKSAGHGVKQAEEDDEMDLQVQQIDGDEDSIDYDQPIERTHNPSMIMASSGLRPLLDRDSFDDK